MTAIAMQLGTYHTKSTRAWAIDAAKLPAIAAAHTLNRIGLEGQMPPMHQATQRATPTNVRTEPIMPVSKASYR